MSDVSQTAKHAGIYTIGAIIEKAASFIMLPIYTRHLTTSDYGTIELLQMTTDVFAFIAGVGLARSVFRFYYRYDTDQERKRVVSTAGILFLSFFFVATVIGQYSSPFFARVVLSGSAVDLLCFRILFATFFLQSFVTMPLVFIQAQQKPKLFVVFSIAKLFLQLSLNVYFVVFLKMGALGVMYALFITRVILSVILSVYTLRRVGMGFSKSLAKELLVFGFPIVIASLGDFVITFSDRYFLKTYADLSTVGVYSLGYKFGFILLILAAQPFYRIWEPKRFEIVNRPDAKRVYQRVFLLFNLFMVSMALGLSLFCHDLLRIMSNEEFWDAAKIVPLIMIVSILKAWADFVDFGIQWKGKTKYLAYATNVSAVAIIVFSFLLIPPFKAMGAALATIIAYIVKFTVVYFYSQREYRLDLLWGRTILLIAIAITVYLASSWVVQESVVLSVLKNVAAFALFIIIVMLTPILDGKDKQLFVRFLKAPMNTVRELRK